jgi:hypothetical protein
MVGLTEDPQDPRLKRKRPDGMDEAYLVLSEAERARGLVEPVRTQYMHVGVRPKHPTRPLTDEERATLGTMYEAFEPYNDDGNISSVTGRYWTAAQLRSGCNTVTTMSYALAETYARDPGFYGATFCAYCRKHLPVGEHGEFVWVDPATGRVTQQRVGTRAAAEISSRPLGEGERCHHCGSLPDSDGDHSCPCPYTDDECPLHPKPGDGQPGWWDRALAMCVHRHRQPSAGIPCVECQQAAIGPQSAIDPKEGNDHA